MVVGLSRVDTSLCGAMHNLMQEAGVRNFLIGKLQKLASANAELGR